MNKKQLWARASELFAKGTNSMTRQAKDQSSQAQKTMQTLLSSSWQARKHVFSGITKTAICPVNCERLVELRPTTNFISRRVAPVCVPDPRSVTTKAIPVR